MSGANVEDIEVFRTLKVALIKFRQTADTALMNGDARVVRSLSWLENEQITHWNGQIRKRTEELSRAADAVRSKKIFKDSTGRTPDASREEKMYKLCQTRLAEAEQKLAATKRAIPKLQKEIEVYRGGVQGLGNLLVTDLPKAIALADRMANTLQEYVDVALSAEIEPSTMPSDSAMPTEPPQDKQQEQPTTGGDKNNVPA